MQFKLLILSAFLAGCAHQHHGMDSMKHDGPMIGGHFQSAANQSLKGMVMVHAMDGHLMLKGKVMGLKPNSEHGFHIHEVGDCSKADFTSAGGHFNPSKTSHGGQGGDHHAGDMPNLKANEQGEAKFEVMLMDLSVDKAAANSIIGRAVVIHANPDDYTTQPSGNSGARIGCAVISEMKM
ncbi:superoxide dismutase family protein [Chitinibacter sp. SCUT-21]|uniref:superoxide dismutase family protein n=1 Tax=Chitinibacter sp. SCUT-21 TaxID=2970891 RepID=UPI0035A71880